jgi:hypothetical protein
MTDPRVSAVPATGSGPVRCLVAGSYPPVPGAPAAATVAAVRRAWEAGLEVVVVSPRPSAAPFVLAVTGRGLARQLAALARRHGCERIVLCAEPSWPLCGRRPERRAWALASTLGRFGHAELVVTGSPEELGSSLGALAIVGRATATVTAGSEVLAEALRAVGAGAVQVAEPFAGAGLRPELVAGAGGAAVGPLEPGALLLAARARRMLSRTARAVLGRRAPAVRARLAHIHRRLRARAR